ncbi:MAG: hypothetical protein JNL92_17095 [Opitutaceae bacterium]|nr:hypothetical protein [Opitutaceae bacterium]
MNDYFLADDLSGALDAAAAFHQAGRRVVIALDAEAWPAVGPNDVVGVTTETRNAAPDEAARVVTQAIARGRARGGRLRYKKIDSTLRGPVAAEVAALLAAWPEARVLFAPANPRVGRTVQAGRLLVRGVPVAETEFGRDPIWPVRESALRALLGPAAGPRVVIPDTATEAELRAAVAEMEAEAGPWVPVGSGALARAVESGPQSAGPAASGLPEENRRAAAAGLAARGAEETPRVPPRGPVVMIGGSAHPGNRVQAARLTAGRGVPVCEVEVTDGERTVSAALAALREYGGVSLMAPGVRMAATEALRATVAVSQQVLARGEVARVFVTGGETAFALARALGVSAFEFRAEIEAGLALARSGEGVSRRWWAVKPGGFGDAETWVRAWDALKGVE